MSYLIAVEWLTKNNSKNLELERGRSKPWTLQVSQILKYSRIFPPNKHKSIWSGPKTSNKWHLCLHPSMSNCQWHILSICIWIERPVLEDCPHQFSNPNILESQYYNHLSCPTRDKMRFSKLAIFCTAPADRSKCLHDLQLSTTACK